VKVSFLHSHYLPIPHATMSPSINGTLVNEFRSTILDSHGFEYSDSLLPCSSKPRNDGLGVQTTTRVGGNDVYYNGLQGCDLASRRG